MLKIVKDHVRKMSINLCTCGSRPPYQLVHLVDLFASCCTNHAVSNLCCHELNLLQVLCTNVSCWTYVEGIKFYVATWTLVHVSNLCRACCIHASCSAYVEHTLNLLDFGLLETSRPCRAVMDGVVALPCHAMSNGTPGCCAIFPGVSSLPHLWRWHGRT